MGNETLDKKREHKGKKGARMWLDRKTVVVGLFGFLFFQVLIQCITLEN